MSAILLMAALAAAAPLPDLASPDARRASEAIRPEAIRAHVRYLADDLLEGRGTGTRGYELAAKYVAAQLEALGLEPAGSDGTYFQPVPFVRGDLDIDASTVSITSEGRETKLTWGREYVMSPDLLRDHTSVEAPVVFVGFGITAPDLGWDDYAGVDAKGKVVAILSGGPEKLEAAVRAVLSDSTAKEHNAVAHGAVGTIRLFTSREARMLPWDRVVNQVGMGSMAWLDKDGRAHDKPVELRGSAGLSEAGAALLFAGSGHLLEEAATAARQKPASLALKSTIRIDKQSRLTHLISPNVVAVLRGSDPALRDEYVVYTAHLDHLGIGPAIGGDTIYNGAMDNASGTAAVMEVARAFTTLPTRPARSILFVAVTGEERGLLGSEYFANNPTVPIAQVVTDINIDEPPAYPSADIVPLGGEHSSLMDNVRRAAAVVGYDISPDPIPEQVFFIRSDQYSLVKQGVPSVYVEGGEKSVDPKVDVKALNEEWRKNRYHAPSDDFQQPIDWEAMTKFTRLDFLIGLDVASQPARPRWNEGDIFGKRFAR